MGALHSYSVVFALIGCMGQAQFARADNPFPRLAGSWSGSGHVQFDQGKSEQITCKAYYTAQAEGSGLAMAFRCASSSYKIEMRAGLSQQDGRVVGHWEERTFNAAGSVSGRATPTNLDLAISGAVSGTMFVTSNETGQRVELKTVGSGLTGVTINLVRS